jgi:hypothetical protein
MTRSALDLSAFDWIRGIYFSDREYPPRTSEVELKAIEKALNVCLPASYCDFAQRFGLGGMLHTLPELLPLFPLRGQAANWWDSVVDATHFHRSPEAEIAAPTDFLQQAVVFGVDEGAHVFLFHTGEVTTPDGNEYRIYTIPRHEDPEPIADSFLEWLRWNDKVYRFEDEGSQEEHDKEEQGLAFDPESTKPSPMPYWRTAL